MGQDPVTSIRLPSGLLKAVDSWAKENDASRSKAIRQLVERGLGKGAEVTEVWDENALRELIKQQRQQIERVNAEITTVGIKLSVLEIERDSGPVRCR